MVHMIRETPAYPSDACQERVVPAEQLRLFVAKMYQARGMAAEDAKFGADRLVESDLRGIPSHGVGAVQRYIEAMEGGAINEHARITTERETSAMAVLDGNMGLGHVAATVGMRTAIEKAREVGTGTVAVKRSQHFGAASLYALMAAEAGMIGYCTTSTGPASVAAYGSRTAGTANNAFAWGVPTGSGAPFVLDMACAVSSWGKVHSMGRYGQAIPEGWALDEHGNPTTDATAAKVLLPAAGARGYGLAFACSALAGPLVGARMPIHKTWDFETDGSEHFFYAIDVEKFIDRGIFLREVDTSIADLHALAPAEGFERVVYPGELEWRCARERQQHGIPVHQDTVQMLEELAGSMQLEAPWQNG